MDFSLYGGGIAHESVNYDGTVEKNFSRFHNKIFKYLDNLDFNFLLKQRGKRNIFLKKIGSIRHFQRKSRTNGLISIKKFGKKGRKTDSFIKIPEVQRRWEYAE